MKYLFALLLLTCALACNDDCNELKCGYLGIWDWESTTGSFAGRTWTPESTGIEKRIEIDEVNIEFYENDSLKQSYVFDIFETDTMFPSQSLHTFIQYDKKTRLIKFEDNILQMHDLCEDCYSDTYLRR